MYGFIINEQERQEVQYLLKREMEEITFDMGDHRIDDEMKRAMEERYHVLYQIFRRFATQEECIQYMPPKKEYN
ncbi:hypothetical protein H0266_18970 [Halobacillus locisalis]|uniref:Uncharacterized protein n=1 Tax=Halobacillus locisalis TaxID=220753 RepID=A0A838CY66_9BACI|nr:hypothetical protein [Halobacillus locisalis]MBA2176967.1 hypothetical protein [Halobacillus locisalis]